MKLFLVGVCETGSSPVGFGCDTRFVIPNANKYLKLDDILGDFWGFSTLRIQ